MKTILTLPLLVFCLAFCLPWSRAQENSIKDIQRILEERIEEYIARAETEEDFNMLLEQLTDLMEHPVNINSAGREDLERIFFLNDMQIYNIMAYRDMYGSFTTLTELAFIDGFDRQTAEAVIPFLYTGDPSDPDPVNLISAVKRGRHDMIMRWERLIQQRKGYNQPANNNLSPGYPGSPDKLLLKYRFKSKDNIRAGITAEKDPGELLIPVWKNDSISKNPALSGYSPDFLSAHVQLNNIGKLKTIVLGDYHLRFGQGLTLWSGYSFGKSSGSVDLIRSAPGISPYSSSDENRFFRGLAATAAFSNVEISGFFSSNLTDAGLPDLISSESNSVTSIRETGLHRTGGEISGKDQLLITAYGGNATVAKKRFRFGGTVYSALLNRHLEASGDIYRKFNFRGNANTNMGLDYMYLWSKAFLFGEMAMSANGGFGVVSGLTSAPHPRFETSLLYRYYSADYQNLYGAAFGENGENRNEKGFYITAKILASQLITINAGFDIYRFDWLQYNTPAPSNGNERTFQISLHPSRSFRLTMRYFSENKTINETGATDVLRNMIACSSEKYRIHAEYFISESVQFKNRIETVHKRDQTGYRGTGWLFYHDIVWKPGSEKYTLAFRYALFDTDSWDERIYAYENDVLYSFSVPAYFYNGSRIYVMLRMNPLQKISVWLRISHTAFLHNQSIGSGLDEIKGNRKTDVKVQLRWKF